MEFYQLINRKLLTTTCLLLSLAQYENFYAYDYENAKKSWHFHIYQQRNSMFSYAEHENSFYNSGACSFLGATATEKCGAAVTRVNP